VGYIAQGGKLLGAANFQRPEIKNDYNLNLTNKHQTLSWRQEKKKRQATRQCAELIKKKKKKIMNSSISNENYFFKFACLS